MPPLVCAAQGEEEGLPLSSRPVTNGRVSPVAAWAGMREPSGASEGPHFRASYLSATKGSVLVMPGANGSVSPPQSQISPRGPGRI